VHSTQCCEGANQKTAVAVTAEHYSFARRLRANAGWIVPSGGLLLLPKCPACLAAYAAIIAGLGISLSAAAYLRLLLLSFCIASIAYWVTRRMSCLFTQRPPMEVRSSYTCEPDLPQSGGSR
jgi:hypothetical protein